MPAVYDNWERLVTATLRREQLRESALRTPSDLSSVSSLSLRSPLAAVGDSFTYFQALVGTDCFNDSKLIKHSHSGDFYLGVLESGIRVVVKKVSSLEQESCLMSEVEICGTVKNSRLIPLLGHCSENADEKFLVYKYMPNRDLSMFLSAKIDDDRQSKSSLDWATRLKIATETAEGLCYLHHQCFPPIVHGDVQASSILLDEEFNVQLGSLGRVSRNNNQSSQNWIARFLPFPRGFLQSNSGESSETCAYDVYCFGKVMLELVTGTLLNDSSVKDQIAKALRCIVSDNKQLITKIVDSFLILDEHLLVEVWAVALVAKACLSPKPSTRPNMAEILKALSRINLERAERLISTGTGKSAGRASGKVYPNGEILVHHSLKVFTFPELEDATRNSMLLVRDEVWQWREAEVELLGRISHPNILKPLGYCRQKGELILVDEFMHKGSLKKNLFIRDPGIECLTWKMRLKILIGAAKGLAFLHASVRQGIFPHIGGFYGHFSCSKILIDSDYNAKITGFRVRVATLVPSYVHEPHPVKFMKTEDAYAAPEYKAKGKSFLESDVYGFGLVLLRMLTGEETYGPTVEIRKFEPRKFVEEKMDPRLKGKFPPEAAEKMLRLSRLCLRRDRGCRPSMEQVVEILQLLENGSAFLIGTTDYELRSRTNMGKKNELTVTKLEQNMKDVNLLIRGDNCIL